MWSGGGGFGDPFERDIENISQDLEDFAISPAAALNIYGVVISENGKIDTEKTTCHRNKIRDSHKIKARAVTREGVSVYESSECLEVRKDEKGWPEDQAMEWHPRHPTPDHSRRA